MDGEIPMSAARLFDHLIRTYNLKNDRELSQRTGINPANISRCRAGKIAFGDIKILAVHDAFDMPIKEIKGLLNEA